MENQLQRLEKFAIYKHDIFSTKINDSTVNWWGWIGVFKMEDISTHCFHKANSIVWSYKFWNSNLKCEQWGTDANSVYEWLIHPAAAMAPGEGAKVRWLFSRNLGFGSLRDKILNSLQSHDEFALWSLIKSEPRRRRSTKLSRWLRSRASDHYFCSISKTDMHTKLQIYHRDISQYIII